MSDLVEFREQVHWKASETDSRLSELQEQLSAATRQIDELTERLHWMEASIERLVEGAVDVDELVDDVQASLASVQSKRRRTSG